MQLEKNVRNELGKKAHHKLMHAFAWTDVLYYLCTGEKQSI